MTDIEAKSCHTCYYCEDAGGTEKCAQTNEEVDEDQIYCLTCPMWTEDVDMDDIIEELWLDFADAPFDEDEDGNLILAEPWYIFDAKTKREDIWQYFDELYSGGVYVLLYGER